ncbi:glycosyltransferase [Kitasatospora sp. NPDC001540]|uniref:glycosyltransferase n=1 Tax=Kitasatospora sp. NPDC001540 TaxID=3364014 RepID=UPI0036B6E710
MRALLCPLTSPGYSHPATAVALELHRRGHEVTFCSGAAALAPAAAAGLDVRPGAAEAAFDVSRWFQAGEVQYRTVLEAARAVRADVVVTSVLCLGALLAAETLGLPVVVLGLACHLWTLPDASGPAGDRERADRERADRAWREEQTLAHLDRTRRALGLPGRDRTAGAGSLYGQAFLLRGHPDLEPPGAVLPARVRHVGPLWWEPPADPAEREAVEAFLDRGAPDRSAVYVHLGRTFGGSTLWPWIERAFTGTGHRAVVELGRTEEHRPAPGADVLAVRHRWMGPLLDRVDLVAANGTSAPVLGALLHDRPLLLRPNGGEQPVVGGAALAAGVAVELTESPADPEPFARVLGDPALRSRVRRLGESLRQAKSAALAAQAVEEAGR